MSLMMILDDKPFEGGIPLIPDSWNQNFVKTGIAIGGLMCAGWIIKMMLRVIKSPTKQPHN